MSEQLWRVGELAKRTGLTVRTLHHYDSIGLFSPSQLTESGHRLYSDHDIGQLQQILMLRQLGFSLDEIKTIMNDPHYDASVMLQMHLGRINGQINDLQALRERVQQICDFIQSGQPVPAEQLVVVIRLMNMIRSPHFGFEDTEAMRYQYQTAKKEELQESFAAGQELLADFRSFHDAGKPPHDPDVLALAQRWKDGIEAMIPASDDFVRSAESYYRENPDQGLMYGMDGELYLYIKKAVERLAASQQGQSAREVDHLQS